MLQRVNSCLRCIPSGDADFPIISFLTEQYPPQHGAPPRDTCLKLAQKMMLKPIRRDIWGCVQLQLRMRASRLRGSRRRRTSPCRRASREAFRCGKGPRQSYIYIYIYIHRASLWPFLIVCSEARRSRSASPLLRIETVYGGGYKADSAECLGYEVGSIIWGSTQLRNSHTSVAELRVS